MQKKLIKLSDTHYIIVDDSEIKKGDWFFNFSMTDTDIQQVPQYHKFSKCITINKTYAIDTLINCGSPIENKRWHVEADIKTCKKITHSTEPLEGVKPLTLSEVEEVIYGYSVEKMAREYTVSVFHQNTFIKGFKAHQELVKDKLFTMEDMINVLKLYKIHIKTNDESKHKWLQEPKEFIQSLLPKTEWEIEFDEQGKLKLV